MRRIWILTLLAVSLSAQTGMDDMTKTFRLLMAIKSAEESGLLDEATFILEVCKRHPEEKLAALAVMQKVATRIDKARGGK